MCTGGGVGKLYGEMHLEQPEAGTLDFNTPILTSCCTEAAFDSNIRTNMALIGAS